MENLVNMEKLFIKNNNLLIKYEEELNSIIYECAISHSYASEPYICYCGCGSLFDKSSIEPWLARSNTCPISRRNIVFEKLTHDRVRKNKVIDLLENIKNMKNTINNNKLSIENYKKYEKKSNNFISYNTYVNNNNKYYQIKTTNSEVIKQTIYFLVDTSYSMNSKIEIKDSEIKCNLSYLDLVKHSLGVFCKLLENNTNVDICIIKFSDNAKVIFEPQYITSANIDSTIKSISNLCPEGQTNIYSGFLQAFTYIKNSNNYSSIVLLTDGVPTKHYTPNGLNNHIFKSITKYNILDKICINTIGLGYNLEIQSLLDLSAKTNGCYFYMPESSMVGPTIIHLLINLITKCCKSVYLEFTFNNKSELDYTINNSNLDLFNCNINNNSLYITLDSLNINQDYVIKLNNTYTPKNVEYIMIDIYNNKINISENKNNTINIFHNDLRLNSMYILYKMYNKLITNIYNVNDVKNDLTCLINNLKNGKENDDYAEALILDISEQIFLGMTNIEYFNKWGKYFVPSIIYFHNKKICPNFIQPGLQYYKTETMKELAEDYLEIFCTYTPPTTNNNTRSINTHSINNTYQNSDVPVNNTLYRSISNSGCFHGDSLVQISENKVLPVHKLKKNMEVLTSEGNMAIIECVITFPCDKTMCLSEFKNGLKITPYHPININNIKDKWVFPIDLVGAKNIKCDKVYNFILNTRQSIIVNNVVCCTLGHKINSPVVAHDFFGTNKVINNLKNNFSKKYHEGLIDNITTVIRSRNTNNIIEYK